MTSTFDAAAVAVFYKGSILLGKRIEVYKGEPVTFGGYWSIFGGALEAGESAREAATRELCEETQICISSESVAFVASLPRPHGFFSIYAYESPHFLSPILDFEHTECGWFAVDSLKTFSEKIDFELVRCILEYDDRRP